jgi:hypothetical protein
MSRPLKTSLTAAAAALTLGACTQPATTPSYQYVPVYRHVPTYTAPTPIYNPVLPMSRWGSYTVDTDDLEDRMQELEDRINDLEDQILFNELMRD